MADGSPRNRRTKTGIGVIDKPEEAQKWPHDMDVEEAVIGVALAKPELIDELGSIQEEDFFAAWHRRVWALIEIALESGRQPSALTVISELRALRAQGHLEHMPDESFERDLNEIAILGSLVRPSEARAAGDCLRSLSQRRSLIATLDAGMNDARAAMLDDNPAAVAARIIDAVQAVSPVQDNTKTRAEELDAILARAERAEADTGLKVYTGLDCIDDKIGGYRAGELHIIGARPGMGKTIVGANIALNAAERGQGALYFSIEMSSSQLSARVLCDMVHRSGHELWTNSVRKGSIPRNLMKPLIDARYKLEEMPFNVIDKRGITLAEMSMVARDCRRQMQKAGTDLSLIVVDYMTLIQPSDRYKGNKVAEVTELSRGLKIMAGDLNIPVVALCQLNRNTEARGNVDNRPRLSDLRESGSIEQDADTISLLFREEYYVGLREPSNKGDEGYAKWQADMAECRDRLEINLAKNRDGETGILEARILARCSAVRDL